MRKKFKRGTWRKIGKEIMDVFRGAVKFYKWQKIFVGLLIILAALLPILYHVYKFDFTIAGATVRPEVTASPTPTVSPTSAPTEEPKPQYKIVTKEKLIAKHTLYKEGSSVNRNINMRKAANIINAKTKGYILQPGEKFKWSRVVGPTTAKKGFLVAGTIKDGQPANDLGGGVCQVSSCIYSAAYDAGIIKKGKYHAERHTLPSAYIHAGDHEATVAVDHKPIRDFWFENTLENSIRIKVKTKDGKVTVKIYEKIKKRIEV